MNQRGSHDFPPKYGGEADKVLYRIPKQLPSLVKVVAFFVPYCGLSFFHKVLGCFVGAESRGVFVWPAAAMVLVESSMLGFIFNDSHKQNPIQFTILESTWRGIQAQFLVFAPAAAGICLRWHSPGQSWDVSRLSWDVPGQPWDVPGRSRGIPGTFQSSTGAVRAALKRSKAAPRTPQSRVRKAPASDSTENCLPTVQKQYRNSTHMFTLAHTSVKKRAVRGDLIISEFLVSPLVGLANCSLEYTL